MLPRLPRPRLVPCGASAGHTSWSTSGLGFLTFWLLGKLRVFADGSAAPERFALAMAPLLGAAWIGMSRIQVSATPGSWGRGRRHAMIADAVARLARRSRGATPAWQPCTSA